MRARQIRAYEWKQPPTDAPDPSHPRFRNLSRIQDGITFQTDLPSWNGKTYTMNIVLTVKNADVMLDFDQPDHSADFDFTPSLAPFVLDVPNSVLAIADYSNGHIYSLDSKDVTHIEWIEGGRLDMPWVGLCSLDKGFGCIVILDTSDDSVVRCVPTDMGGKSFLAPNIVWTPSKGKFAYMRRLIYRFTDKGGYVALAKAYRAYAIDKGLIVTLAEKLKKNPNLSRLFGAPDVWGDSSIEFAREAKAAGVDKMLVQGSSSSETLKAVNDLGYITSRYDNYTDIIPVEPGKFPDSDHDLIPDHVVMNADGSRRTAWITWDKKTTYMKRCPSFWRSTAWYTIRKDLRVNPFIGRFIDVTSAEALYECYDSNHPLTNSAKRQCGVDLLSMVGSLGLVVGGEHGVWWAVPHLDYIEGMMSGGHMRHEHQIWRLQVQ